jgi:subtilisin-like proprotein convertase family protein
MTHVRTRTFLAAIAGLSLVLGGLLTGGSATAQPAPTDATFPGTGLGAIPDGGAACAPTPGAPLNVTFNVTGLTGPLTDVRVTGLTFSPVHTYVGDLQVSLIAPNGTSFVVFSRTGATTTPGAGDSSDAAGPYTFADDAAGNWWTAAAAAGAAVAIPAGSYRTSQEGGLVGSTGTQTNLTAAFAGVTNPNGTWTLRFLDGCSVDTGTVSAVSLGLKVSCATQQAAVNSATAAAAAADQAVASANKAVSKAKKAVKKAKKALKAAVKSGNPVKIAKAKSKLKKAKKKLKKAKAARTAAIQAAATAHAQLSTAQSALLACNAANA